ncbi:MAG: PfkB family carbohydrate kinase, partial [Burkholderiaceae bacterium]
VMWFDGKRVSSAPSPRVKVVDTLAAGDTWHGAFALALAERKDLLAAIEFATAVAALKCTRFGGRAGIPKREQFERWWASLDRG